MPDALTGAYQRQLKMTRNAVGDAVGRQWKHLGSYNEADVPRFVDAVSPIVAAGQSRAVALTSAYLSRKLGQPPMGLTMAGLPPIRNGVPLDVVYRRPFVRVWSALKALDGETDDGEDDGYDYAVQLGEDQATSNSLMDIALATMASYVGFALLSKGGIRGWVRRADPGCCSYCQDIDGAYTGPDEPQPLHNRCGCTADPVTSDDLGGASLSPGSTHGDTAIHEHGELGPVIAKKGDSFAGPEDIPAGEE